MSLLLWLIGSHDLQDGRHVIPQAEEKFTQEELKVMKTQDLKYVQMKLNTETKVSGVDQSHGVLVTWWTSHMVC